MCVIAICEKQPTITDLRAMWDANPQGAGLAWSDGKTVHYKRGIMTFDALREAVGKMSGPFVVHTRISTVGGTRPDLCHPFVASPSSPLALKGKAPMVLFHNGHWGDWANNLRESTVSTGARVPDGAFSDSRAMAVLVGRHGQNFARLIPDSQRVCIVTATSIARYGKGWTQVRGMWVSNENWLPREQQAPWYVSNARGSRSWSRSELLLDPPKRREPVVEPTMDDVVDDGDPVEMDPDADVDACDTDEQCAETDYLFPEVNAVRAACARDRK
jgi:hypothetical protein